MRVFIHIPKNGGMTIRRGLPGRILTAGPDLHKSPEYTAEVFRTMQEHSEHHGYEHARWRDLARNQYPTFAIVRNPWSRTVSRYTFSVVAEGKDYTFREFLAERHEYGGKPYFWHRAIRGWYPQRDYVVDDDGVNRCDVLRLESQDVERYFELDGPLRRRNVSNTGRDYRDFYGPKEYDIVADWYSDDIEFFGFDFDGPATRNLWTPTS